MVFTHFTDHPVSNPYALTKAVCGRTVPGRLTDAEHYSCFDCHDELERRARVKAAMESAAAECDGTFSYAMGIAQRQAQKGGR